MTELNLHLVWQCHMEEQETQEKHNEHACDKHGKQKYNLTTVTLPKTADMKGI